MTRKWAYGNEAAYGRVSDPAAACFPVAGYAASRSRLKISSAPAGDCFKPQVPLASAAPEHRSADFRLAVPILPVDSECNRHSQAGDGDPVASARLPCLLALEVSAARRTSEDSR